MLSKFRAKPVVLEAVRLTKENATAVREFIGKHKYDDSRDGHDPVNIMLRSAHGNVLLEVGDWLVKDAQGDYYPCKDSIFKAKYEPVGVAK